MAMPNEPPTYRMRASTEDMLALCCGAIDNQKAMLILSFQGEGPEAMDAIFNEARRQAKTLEQLMRHLQRAWCEIQALIEDNA